MPAARFESTQYRNTISAIRNRLSHVKADKLVALFHNLRLLTDVGDAHARATQTEPAIGWSDDL